MELNTNAHFVGSNTYRKETSCCCMFSRWKFGHGGARNRECNCFIEFKDLVLGQIIYVHNLFPSFPFLKTILLPGI